MTSRNMQIAVLLVAMVAVASTSSECSLGACAAEDAQALLQARVSTHEASKEDMSADTDEPNEKACTETCKAVIKKTKKEAKKAVSACDQKCSSNSFFEAMSKASKDQAVHQVEDFEEEEAEHEAAAEEEAQPEECTSKLPGCCVGEKTCLVCGTSPTKCQPWAQHTCGSCGNPPKKHCHTGPYRNLLMPDGTCRECPEGCLGCHFKPNPPSSWKKKKTGAIWCSGWHTCSPGYKSNWTNRKLADGTTVTDRTCTPKTGSYRILRSTGESCTGRYDYCRNSRLCLKGVCSKCPNDSYFFNLIKSLCPECPKCRKCSSGFASHAGCPEGYAPGDKKDVRENATLYTGHHCCEKCTSQKEGCCFESSDGTCKVCKSAHALMKGGTCKTCPEGCGDCFAMGGKTIWCGFKCKPGYKSYFSKRNPHARRCEVDKDYTPTTKPPTTQPPATTDLATTEAPTTEAPSAPTPAPTPAHTPAPTTPATSPCLVKLGKKSKRGKKCVDVSRGFQAQCDPDAGDKNKRFAKWPLAQKANDEFAITMEEGGTRVCAERTDGQSQGWHFGLELNCKCGPLGPTPAPTPAPTELPTAKKPGNGGGGGSDPQACKKPCKESYKTTRKGAIDKYLSCKSTCSVNSLWSALAQSTDEAASVEHNEQEEDLEEEHEQEEQGEHDVGEDDEVEEWNDNTPPEDDEDYDDDEWINAAAMDEEFDQ